MPKTRGERIALAMERVGLRQEQIAEKLGITQSVVSKIVRGAIPGDKHLRMLANILGVPLTWITVGESPPEWAKSDAEPPVAHSVPIEPLCLVGTVKAGNGQVDRYIEDSVPFPLKPSWQVVQVEGMSAYPVVYPGQFVIVDPDRATRPDDMTVEQAIDLHDNMVLLEVEHTGRPAAYLKRFCYAPESPDRFVLASIDSGRGSPYVKPSSILIIVPVVGVIYEDPTKPRKKKWSSKTVIVEAQA